MIGCIVQARMGSSRLPGKVLKKMDEKNTVLDYVINQLHECKNIEKIIIATTELQEDNIICEYLSSKQIEFFRGSSEDVLDRYFQCAKKFSIDTIVRITADNPLIDPQIVDTIIEEYKKGKYDFITNTINRTFPYGTEVEIFSYEILEKAWKKAEKPSEKEHVTTFIKDPKNGFNLENITNVENFSNLRYTVDKKEDLVLVKEIAKNIHNRPILLQDIIELYRRKSKIFEINRNVKHDGYLSSIEKDEQYFKSKNKERT
jgi:spore coat polysaccharide biosynthesis protein SpsF